MTHARYLPARPYTDTDRTEWLRMRISLWPRMNPAEQLIDMGSWLTRSDSVVLVVPRAGDAHAGLAGFAEVGTRSVAESCETSPVAYLEGWYVDPDMRRQGVGAALVRAARSTVAAAATPGVGLPAASHCP